MKVYEVIDFSQFEFEQIINTTICATREVAEKKWKELADRAEELAEQDLNDDECVVDRNDERCWVDVYKDGCASEYESNIYIMEKEIEEE